jgi:predicted RNase H-like nuclease (RuvC/YqgF family)
MPAEAPESYSAPIRQPVTSSPPPEEKFEGSAISQAVSEVTQIIEGLRQSLAQMEEVLELVELAERQKLTDEREIDSLRRALRRIHHPRGEHSHPDE